MSIKSYHRNVRRKVTGPELPTCFPAALEQISPQHSLPASAYIDYREHIERISRFSRAQRQKLQEYDVEIFTGLVKHLGEFTCEDLIFKRARTALGFKRIVHRLLDDGCRIVVDIDKHSWYTTHSVGLIPTGEKDYFTLVSNQIPEKIKGVVSLDAIASRLAQPEEPHMVHYPFNDANITALPPVV